MTTENTVPQNTTPANDAMTIDWLDDSGSISPKRFTPGRVMLAVLVLASFGVWGYAYSGFADRVAPDTFDDPAFALRAEPVCDATFARIEALPQAFEATTSEDRAATIRKANEELARMLDDLETMVTGTERDRGITNLWLDRWRILLADRVDYADRLATDPNALFYVSAEAGRRAERSISYVADTNRMPSCGAPEDVG